MIRTFTRRGWAALAGLGALAVMPAAVDRLPAAALVNESASLPRGLYLRGAWAAPGRGIVAAAVQPTTARAYLVALEIPHDMLLIKRVAAVGGDRVCRRGDRVTGPFGEVAAAARDGGGAILPSWSGCRTLAADEVFLLGDTARSFDSRYFGPVRRADLRGVYHRVASW